MAYIQEQLQTPIVAQVDVLVLGGGPAGFSAAVCAGRQGANVMMVESSGSLGGVATIGLMSHWTGSTRGGFYEEIIARTGKAAHGKQTISHEALKHEMFVMAEEANVCLKLYTMAVQPIMEGSAIKGVIVENKSGREAILAKIVIDATGDGDIAARAGAPFCKGREADGMMQPVTLMFQIGGVNLDKAEYIHSFEQTYMTAYGEIQQLAREKLPHPLGHVLIYPSTLKDTVTINMTNMTGIDGTNADSLTAGEVACRKQMPLILEFLRTYMPGFENAYISTGASFLGVRETRHFMGMQRLTEKDIQEARIFDDWVVTKAHFNFDVHNMSGGGLDKTGVQKEFKQAKGYTIPYGVFVPLEIDNLFLCGRNISGTHIAHSNYRAMPICANMGQSVGIAAAMCVRMDCAPRGLDVGILQKELEKNGVTL